MNIFNIDDEKFDKAIDLLKEELNPTFIFFADHMLDAKVFDIAYYSDHSVSEWDTYRIENEISELFQKPVEINNLTECNTDFVAELLSDGRAVYCRDEFEKKCYLNEIRRELEFNRARRAVLINRLAECESVYEQ